VKPSEKNSEWLTRKRLIDPKLKAAGWKVVPFVPGMSLNSHEPWAIEEFETEHGPADYALCVGGRILGIVEAKKLTLGPQSVLTQAERYSKGATSSPLNFRGYPQEHDSPNGYCSFAYSALASFRMGCQSLSRA
jgi:type I restriction enzyme, R subunit